MVKSNRRSLKNVSSNALDVPDTSLNFNLSASMEHEPNARVEKQNKNKQRKIFNYFNDVTSFATPDKSRLHNLGLEQMS